VKLRCTSLDRIPVMRTQCNAVSLSFGALAINDVVAAALTVAFCEVVSKQYYSAAKITLKLLFANCFKIGIISALIADAFKLGG